MICCCPFAGNSFDEPPVSFDLPILPGLKPLSCLVGDCPAAFAALSTLFKMGLLLPFCQIISVRTLHNGRRVRSSFHRSALSTNLTAFVFQPFLRQTAGIIWLSKTYRESVTICTRLTSIEVTTSRTYSSAPRQAFNSIRLLELP